MMRNFQVMIYWMPTTAAKAQAIPQPGASIMEVVQSALPLYLNGNTQPFNATHHPAMAVPWGCH